MRGRFEPFISNANEVIVFKLITNENDLNEETKSSIQSFNPEFSHQFFGDNEQIFGYKDLKVKLYYSSARLFLYLGMSSTEKLSKEESEGIEADNVLKIIVEKLGGIRFTNNLDEFSASLSKESSFKPYGELVNSFAIDEKTIDSEMKRYFEIYRTDLSFPGFNEYHKSMQTFLLWFIDAASYIDEDDDRWDFFTIYEKKYLNSKTSLSNGHSANSEPFVYVFVGYASIYRYFAYPEKIRPRISQFLILPPFQKRGLGVRLLQTIYDVFQNDNNITDVTVEDPSENFTRLRDFVDSRNCLKLESFSEDKLKLGWNEEMANEAQNKLKISKRQARRVFEILRFRITDKSNETDYKNYRIIIKQRLNAPFQKQLIDFEKLKKEKTLTDKELIAFKQTSIIPNDVRLDLISKQYKDLEDEYNHIIERLELNH
jgi:histone acetyltransferase 1